MQGYTPAQLENVQQQAYTLAVGVGKLVGEDPTLMVATLTMAACHAALLSDVSYEDLKTLFELHYTSAAAGIAAREVEDATGQKVLVDKIPEGKS